MSSSNTTGAYLTPEPSDQELQVISRIDDLRQQMKDRLVEPRRWAGGLRRMLFTRAVQASNSIEGYYATESDVVAIEADEPPLEANEETRLAVSGYRDAMTYVLQLAQDEDAMVDEGLLKSLHFMTLKYDLARNPGRWRPGPIWVRREDTGEIVYEGPPSELVPELIDGMLDELATSPVPPLIRAAMSHLNLVMIHPFSDGNGRMARCLQTLVLAREKIVSPVFSSIEEYLGRNTKDYYDILAAVGQGQWKPQNDARPWVRFCLTAHYRQARSMMRRVFSFEKMWAVAAEIVAARRLPERTIGPTCEAAYGLRVRRATYKDNVEVTYGEEIPDLTASRDLKALVTAGLFVPIGDTRGRFYVASEELKEEWLKVRAERPPKDTDDPFVLVEQDAQQQLDIGVP